MPAGRTWPSSTSCFAARAAETWRHYEAQDNALHRAIARAAANSLTLALFDALNAVRRGVVWGRPRDNTERPPGEPPLLHRARPDRGGDPHPRRRGRRRSHAPPPQDHWRAPARAGLSMFGTRMVEAPAAARYRSADPCAAMRGRVVSAFRCIDNTCRVSPPRRAPDHRHLAGRCALRRAPRATMSDALRHRRMYRLADPPADRTSAASSPPSRRRPRSSTTASTAGAARWRT
jgi:hypothetical protein